MEIALAVVGVTDVAVRASSKLWALSTAWRDAPADLHNLRDDLTRTERFFGEIQLHLKSTQFKVFPLEKEVFPDSPTEQSELGRLVDEGGVALRRIEAIVDGLTVADDAETQSMIERVGELGKKRKFLWLRHSRKVARLRKELGYVRSSICRLLITQNISMSTGIYTSLEQSQHEVRSQLSNLSLSLDTSQDTVISQLQDRIQAMESRMLLAIQQDHSSAKTTILAPPAQPLTHYPPHPQYQPDPYTTSSLSPRRTSLCPTTCPCPCHHSTTSLWRLTLLRSIIGMVAIAYTTRSSSPCTNAPCLSSPLTSPSMSQPHRRPTRSHDVYLAVRLPPWLARTSLSVFATTNLHGSPALNLRIYYRRSPHETQAPLGVGRLIEKGDTEGVREALKMGRAGVNDLFCEAGTTALFLAVNVQRPEIVRLYLQAGADPFHKDDEGMSVIGIAFQLWCSGVKGDKEMGELFPIGRYVDEADFTGLHRAVLLGAGVAGALAGGGYDGEGKGKGDINGKGGEGWTALHLAALKGDASSAKLLVRAGADPDCKTDRLGVTPLYYACRYGHYEVVKVLLNGGADVHLKDNYDRQAIHCAGITADGRRVLELLLKHGADLEAREKNRYTPLTFATVWGPTDVVEFLIEMGADLGARTGYGDTLIMMAVKVVRHDRVRMLLRSGADLQVLDRNHRSILHLLATNSDEEMINIFIGSKLWKGVATSAKDELGLTPLSLFNQRDPSEGLREAFDRLLDWVERCNDDELTAAGDGDESEDEFFDAEDGELKDNERTLEEAVA